MPTTSRTNMRWSKGIPQLQCESCRDWLPVDQFITAGRVCKVCREIIQLYGERNTENILSITELAQPPDAAAFQKAIAPMAGKHIRPNLQSKKVYSRFAWDKVAAKTIYKELCTRSFKPGSRQRQMSFCRLICSDKLTPEQTLWLCFRGDAVFDDVLFGQITHRCLEEVVVETELQSIYEEIFEVLDNPTRKRIYAVNQSVLKAQGSLDQRLAAQALTAFTFKINDPHGVALFAASSLVTICKSVEPLIGVLRAVADKHVQEHEAALEGAWKECHDLLGM
jgi:hypothetical protein